MTPKLQSILSYLGILWLVAYFVGKEQRNDVSRYHLKQGLGLFIVSLVFGIVLQILMTITTIFGLLGLIILFIFVMGIINAINEEKKPLPFIGKFFENQFSFIDKD